MKKVSSRTLRQHYYYLAILGTVQLLTAMTVAGMCATIVAKVPDGILLPIAAYSLVHSVLHFHWIRPTMHCATSPGPTNWFIIRLTFYTLGWIVVSILMFFLIGTERSDTYDARFAKRRGASPTPFSSTALPTVEELLRQLTAASGALGVFALLNCIAQWWTVRRLYTRFWTAKEVEDVFKQMNEKKSFLIL
ncbi:unnamed protein product [Clonostachys solani]|uniref:Uncharacterized protein n=1 Tax=Clonostachys solani TaxID=160281 RepID=A0A9N9ZGS4_9HYPO|nr:unnamed protein product [Clonostachys solani]